MKFGLDQSVINKINSVFARYAQIDEAILYGSRAKGNYKPGSDIDVTLVGTGLKLEILNKILLDLDDLLLPYQFDLSIFYTISNKDLVDHINRVGQTFYKRENKN